MGLYCYAGDTAMLVNTFSQQITAKTTKNPYLTTDNTQLFYATNLETNLIDISLHLQQI